MSLVVIPPRALDGHNAAAIHVLQLGPAAAVTPAGRYRYPAPRADPPARVAPALPRPC